VNLHDIAVAGISYTLQSGLLLLAGVVLPSLLGLRDPRIGLRYWSLLIPVVVLLPFVSLLVGTGQPSVLAQIPVLGKAVLVSQVVPASSQAFPLHLLVAVVTVIATGRLLWIGLGLCRLRAYSRQARSLRPLPAMVSALRRCFRNRARFLVSDHISSPVTFGWRYPTVLVPASFAYLSDDQQEGVACHELLHVLRNDWPVLLVEETLRALLWFHPAVGLLLDRITLSREQVIDAEVVRFTGKRRAYLEALYSIAGGSRRLVAASLLNRSHMKQRVALLAKEVSMSKGRLLVTLTVLAGAMALVAGLGAAAFPIGSPAEPAVVEESPILDAGIGSETEERSEPRRLTEEEILPPKVINKVNPVYPEEAREAKLTGQVVCQVVVSTKGIPTELEILSATDEIFVQPTIDAIEQWRFEPATMHAKPVEVWYQLEANFNLE
jgi:TonB family protein